MARMVGTGGSSKRGGAGHSTDSIFSLGIHVYSGKVRPMNAKPRSKNGPVKIIKVATKTVEKAKDD